ncbi:hypothetical protein FRB96_009124 [Tulasnella sp. 330]|nr:hypothetical protein FRB96_009124 [Tulasnella sp. 330]
MQPWNLNEQLSPSPYKSSSRPRSMQGDPETSRQRRSSLKSSDQSPIPSDSYDKTRHEVIDRGPFTPPIPFISSTTRPATVATSSTRASSHQNRHTSSSSSAVAKDRRTTSTKGQIALNKETLYDSPTGALLSPVGRPNTRSTRARSRSKPRIGRRQMEVPDSSSESDQGDRPSPLASLQSPGGRLSGKVTYDGTSKGYQGASISRGDFVDSPRPRTPNIPDLPITRARSPMSISDQSGPYDRSSHVKSQDRSINIHSELRNLQSTPSRRTQFSPEQPRGTRGPLRVVNSDAISDSTIDAANRTPQYNSRLAREDALHRPDNKWGNPSVTPIRPPLDPSFFRDIRTQSSPSPSLNAVSPRPSGSFISLNTTDPLQGDAIGHGAPTPRAPTKRVRTGTSQYRPETASEMQKDQNRRRPNDRPSPQHPYEPPRREDVLYNSSTKRFVPHPYSIESKAPPPLRSPLEPSVSTFPDTRERRRSLRQEERLFQKTPARSQETMGHLVDGLGLGVVIPPSPDEVLEVQPGNSESQYSKRRFIQQEQAKQRVSLVSERSVYSEDDGHDTPAQPRTPSSSATHGQGLYKVNTPHRATSGSRYMHDDRSQHETGASVPALPTGNPPSNTASSAETAAGKYVREANKALFLALEQSPGAFSVTSAATSRDDCDGWECSPEYTRHPGSPASIDATPPSRQNARFMAFDHSPSDEHQNQEGVELQFGASSIDSHHQNSMLQPQPTITIQSSTSVSSSDALLQRSRSNDSICSDMNLHAENSQEQDVRWSQHSVQTEELSEAARTLLEAVKNWPETEAPRDRDMDASSREPVLPQQNSNHPEDAQPSQTGRQHAESDPAHHAPSRHDQTPSVIDRLSGSSKTWRSTLPPDAHKSLSEKYGALEMRRQEVIWELCNTEQDFVQSLRMTIRVFVQPLRLDGQQWVQGIPKDVTKLFEWLGGITELHSRISSALLDVRSAQYPVVLQMAEYFRGFVPHLDIHQPYLVSLEGVSQTIEEALRDSQSDLGEFLRIQSTSAECGSMSLTSFLLKPVQRLMKYPLFLKQLWELTPRNHPDHLATFSLLHSTETVIKVMQEVKAREEEYDLIKSLTNRIKGLPAGFQLAHRDRRLVAQGLLRRINPSDKDQAALNSAPPTWQSATDRISSQTFSSASPSIFSAPMTPNLAKLMPITAPRSLHQFSPGDHTHGPIPTFRPDSTASDLTTSSEDSRSITSSNLHMSPSTTMYSLRNDTGSRRSFENDYPGEKFMDSHEQAQSQSRGSSIRGSLRLKREVQVYAFVFTDLVLLTAPVSERHTLRSPKGAVQRECWKVLDDVGLCRVLGVTNHSGRLNYEHLLALDLLPMTPGRNVDLSETICATPVFLSLPERMASKMALGPPQVLEEARQKWLEAFDKCVQYTFRSLCLPTRHQYPDLASSLDAVVDPRYSVLSILASGDLLPRTSCLPDLEAEAMTGLSGDESRWWMAKFQRVVREMEVDQGQTVHQLLALAPATAVQPRRQRTAELKSNSSLSGPRPLLLASVSAPPPEERKGLLRSFSRKARS